MDHANQRSLCPAAEKKCYNCSKTGHFARMCQASKKQFVSQEQRRPPARTMAKYLSVGKKTDKENEKDNSSDSDFVFKTETTSKSILPTIPIQINGIKGKAEADSCSTANIIDEERFELLQNALKRELKLKPANTNVYAYGQDKPIPLIGSFEAEVKSIKHWQDNNCMFSDCQRKYEIKTTPQSRHKCKVRGPEDNKRSTSSEHLRYPNFCE
jgi:hypothetical protein